MLEVRNVSYSYRFGGQKKDALKDVSFTLGAGNFIALIGPNGSGKSTLAKHLNALLLPEKGWVAVDGLRTDVMENKWEIRQRVGMVFQNPENQIVAPVVEEDVAFGPENLGLSRTEISARVEEALVIVGLENRRRHMVNSLSGGQKQRLAIAGALALKPSYLVLDEPTSMLDPKGRSEIIEFLEKICRHHNLTVILITHLMVEVISANRVLLLHDGKLVSDTDPRELFSKAPLLEEVGLELPDMSSLALMLARRGWMPPRSILTVEDMVGWLCSLDWKT